MLSVDFPAVLVPMSNYIFDVISELVISIIGTLQSLVKIISSLISIPLLVRTVGQIILI